MITIDLADPLLAFGKALGIEPDIWEKREVLEQITYTKSNLSRENAKKLTLDLIVLLQEAYGESLSCTFLLSDRKLLDINSKTDAKDLEEFRRLVEDSPTIDLEFMLDKKQLVEKKLGSVPGHHIFLYLFPNALERFLRSDLTKLENSLWGLESETLHKVILFLPNNEIWLNGQYLAVLGGKNIERWQEVIIYPKQEDSEHVRNIYNTCQRNLHWQFTWLNHLTPLHLKIDEQILCEDPISRALLIHQVNLIILYTASRTTGNSKYPTLSTYAGTNQSVELTFKNSVDSIEEVFTGANYLMKIFEWAYDSRWSDDRLRLVQIVVTQYLHAASPLTRYQLLLYNAKTILNELKWNWQAFIEGKVNNYVSQIQALEDYVATTVQRFADQTTVMIKNLSDTMLAAVAVSIGSFIATLFKGNFSQDIFTFGMLTYAVYVLIFPLFFNMRHQWEQYELLCNNFEERQRRFAERLYPDKANEIIGLQIENSRNKFLSWFFYTIAAYILVFLLLVIAAMWTPEFAQNTALSVQNTTISTV